MIVTVLAVGLMAGRAMPAVDVPPSVQQVQYGVPRHPRRAGVAGT